LSKPVAAAKRKLRTQSAINHRTLVGHARRERTRARIIEAAAQVFAEKGAQAPLIDDFIRAAEVARGTFYNYFRTTQELLDATVAWSSDDVIRSIEAEIGAYDDAALRLATACRLYLRVAAQDRAWCAFMAQVPHAGGLSRRQLRGDLSNGQAAGIFQFENVEAAYDLVIGAMWQALQRLAGARQRHYTINDVVSMMLRGLGVPAQQVKRLLARPLPELRRQVRSEALFAGYKKT
jgi:AcrR family transcriptional regulator